MRGEKTLPRIDATAVDTGLDWTTVTTEKLAGMAAIVNQEQKCVAVGPGNWHFISVRQVSYDAARMQRDTCGHAAQSKRVHTQEGKLRPLAAIG